MADYPEYVKYVIGKEKLEETTLMIDIGSMEVTFYTTLAI